MRRKKTMKIMACILAASMIMTIVNPFSVSAGISVATENGIADMGEGTAAITLLPNQEAQTLDGRSFHLYKLFHVSNSSDQESVNYTFTEKCKSALQKVVAARLGKKASDVTEYEVIDYMQSLNSHKTGGAQAEQEKESAYSEFRFFIEELRDELKKADAETADTITITNTRDDGTVLIEGLEYGYYVLDEVTDLTGTHSASSLCMVDTANPSAQVSLKADYPTVTKKIQEDDDQATVGNNGWNDMADYEIGQEVPFQVTSNVPDMNGYDTYYYAWHDVMDDGLTFDADSVEITVSSADKEYVLNTSEYTVKEQQEGETFSIVIEDLKKIVDEEFNQSKTADHHIYGQTVTLTYQAILNADAVTGTGGMENDVRLEFSNDPDSGGEGTTGFTPWDTVVCFTYRLNGLKSNEEQVGLEGARFRLYTDESCSREVYVQAAENGYLVINEDSADEAVRQEAVEIVSDEEGAFYITGLDQGTYYLKETQAPDGYRMLTDPIKIDIIPSFAANRNEYIKGTGRYQNALIDLSFTARVKAFFNGVSAEENSELDTDLITGTGNLTVINKKGVKLPVTGSALTLLLVGTGSALMMSSYGIERKKQKNAEKARQK